MRMENIRHPKGVWPKVSMRKWLNIKKEADEFHSDFTINAMAERRRSCSDDGRYAVVPEELSERWLMEANDDIAQLKPECLDLSMFVGTWNVGGKSPHNGLDLREWLRASSPADIYVIGFQEIVPLNAGNVLGTENKSPAARWLSLIRQALNWNETDRATPSNYNTATAGDQQQSPVVKPRVSFSDLLSLEDELDQEQFERFFTINLGEEKNNDSSGCSPREIYSKGSKQNGFCLAANKQMVGIFLCVFVRAELYQHVSNLKVSCVGRGIMGYLGNKGSISISMTLYRTTFCFVCTHLASGEKEGDEFKRNFDVMEILKKTRFSRSFRVLRKPIPPDNILNHDKIIWLGDLNYRLSSSSNDMHELLEKNDWQALLEKDQLRIEQRAGRVFTGWEEGKIYFAPTYKYLTNSDHYVVQTSTPKEKRRTPAWCDRILWKGEGLKQISYVRGESKFSDHRPVYSLFSVQVNLPINQSRITKPTNPNSLITSPVKPTGLLPMLAKVQAEELLVSKTKSCIENTPRLVNKPIPS